MAYQTLTQAESLILVIITLIMIVSALLAYRQYRQRQALLVYSDPTPVSPPPVVGAQFQGEKLTIEGCGVYETPPLALPFGSYKLEYRVAGQQPVVFDILDTRDGDKTTLFVNPGVGATSFKLVDDTRCIFRIEADYTQVWWFSCRAVY